jgi:TPR repeat protein
VEHALELFRQAAASGEGQAMRRLGDIYYEGIDVPKDLAEAEKWYRMAYKAGYKTGLEKFLKETNPKLSAEQRAREDAEAERRKEEERKEVIARTNELFGTIGVALPMSDTGVESPSAAVKGTKFRALKALALIPLAFIVGGLQGGPGGAAAGSLAAPGGVLSEPSERQVRRLQEQFTEAYETHADKAMLENLHAQILSRIAERLHNPVLKVPLPWSSDSASYKRHANVDTVLELRSIVAGLQFTGLYPHSVTVTEQVGEASQKVQRTIQEPKAQFAMIIEYRVISAEDSALIGTDGRADYSSLADTLAGWTADDGAALKESMQTAYTKLADRLTASLLALAEPRPH